MVEVRIVFPKEDATSFVRMYPWRQDRDSRSRSATPASGLPPEPSGTADHRTETGQAKADALLSKTPGVRNRRRPGL